METFLDNIAESYYNYLIDNNNISSLRETIFVFPNKRAGLFFKDAFLNKTTNNIFSPTITDINQLTNSFSDLVLADNTELIFYLYKAYTSVIEEKELTKDTTFESFISFGNSLLSDFNDIDKYQIDANEIFNNISALKDLTDNNTIFTEEQRKAVETLFHYKIENNSDNKLNFKKEFISLWNILSDIYNKFTKNISEDKIAYEGLIYKDTINNLLKNNTIFPFEKIVFIGFNLLTPAEKKIFDFFKNKGMADFYFDYPAQYNIAPFSNTIATNFNNLRDYKSIINFSQPNEKRFPKINIYNTASFSNQTIVAGQLVHNINKEQINQDKSIYNTTSIILADETHISALIDELPEEIDKINITMGYPFNQASIVVLINSIITAKSEITKDIQNNNVFYYKSTLNVLTNPYIQKYHNQSANSLINKINKEQLIRIPQPVIIENNKNNDSILPLIFSAQNNIEELIINLREILKTIKEEIQTIQEDDNQNNIPYQSFEAEFATQYDRYLNKLLRLIQKHEINKTLTINSFNILNSRILSQLKIQFEGQPLEGLQIMGKLEARLLDFENIIIVGFNDNKFPGSNNDNSIIPYIIRKAYNLPTPEHNEAIYAYNFYRMLYRAKNVYLICDSRTDGTKNEISRYYYQIKYLFPEILSPKDIEINQYNVNQNINTNSDKTTNTTTICIEKNENIQEILNQYKSPNCKCSLSASMIKNYIACPLKFYYSAIAKIYQKNELDDSIQANMLGNIFHDSMHNIYINSIFPINIDDNEIKEYIYTSFKNELKINSNSNFEIKGFYKISEEIIFNFIKNTIKYDNARYKKEPFEFDTVNSEEKITQCIKGINFTYLIDRIDIIKLQNNNIKYRIIDYKTTSPSKNHEIFDIDELFSSTDSKYHEVFQILLYCYFYEKKLNVKPTEIQPILYNTYKINKKKISNNEDLDLIQIAIPQENIDKNNIPDNIIYKDNKAIITIESYNDIKEYFEERLTEMLNSIFNKDITFSENPNNKDNSGCKYCPYIRLCNKETEIKNIW